MNPTKHLIFRTFFTLVALWISALHTVAGTWSYSNNRVTHSETAWILNVSLSGTELTVTGVTNAPSVASALPLADTVSGYQITSIGHNAFKDSRKLTSVTIPVSVTSIGSFAFDGCIYLTSLTIPGSVTNIGLDAFSWCEALTNVVIVGGVTSIGDFAFSGCTGLTSLTIPNSVTNIGRFAFQACNGLESVTIPDVVNSIGQSAFYLCRGLTGVTIPDGVTSIGTSAFSGCTGLTNICVSSENAAYCDLNGILFDKALRNLLQFPGGLNGEYTIPSSVINIGPYAFYNCTGLASVTIPGSVTSISPSAFNGCTGLTDVTIPDGVTSIGISAFSGCTGLTSVTIPDRVSSFGGTAFSGCTGLASVVIGRNVVSSPSGTSAPFYNCSRIRDLFFNATNWPSFKASNIFPSSYGGLTNLVIGDGVNSIGHEAFSGCTELTLVTIPDTVTAIGPYAFSGCIKLAAVTIPKGVTSVEGRTFFGCTGLTSVTIPDTVTAIGYEAFSGCTGLMAITIPGNVTSIGTDAFSGCIKLATVAIPNGVTSVGDRTFLGCKGLTGVTIPDGVTSIGISAFSGCSGLTGVTIPDRVASIGGTAFSGCTGLTSVVIGRSVVSSPSGTSAPFYNCSRIRDLFFNATNWPSFKASNIFPSSYSGLTNLVIGGGVSSIGYEAFSGCIGLPRVTIPEGVTGIGDRAFYNCTGLTGLTIPGSATNIGSYAFSGCTRLVVVTIPYRVISIGQSAFSGCTWLTSVFLIGNAPSLGLSVFASCSATIYRMAGAAGWPEVPGLWGGRPTALWYPFSSVGKTNAVQIAVENSGDGGTSVKMGGVGLLADGEMAGIECTAKGPGVMAFEWKVSSEAGWDVLRFYEVGGAVTNVISGATAGWSRVHMTITGASDVIHTFRWEYEKDPYGDYVGQDCGWVDSIGWYPFFTLKVNGGNGNGMYTNGTSVAITADAPPAWQRFDRWIGNTNTVANVFTSSTTLVMPATEAVVTATYVPILYTLSVTNGSGSGSYPFATTVEIGAAPYAGKRFHRWVGDVDTVSDPSSATTTVVTAGHTLSISATYSVPLTVNGGTGSG